MSEETVVEKDRDVLTMVDTEFTDKFGKLVHYTLKKLGIKPGRIHPATGFDYEDFVQIGTIGLLKAKSGFKPSLGFAFSTYAVTKIHGEVVRYLRDGNKIKVPRSVYEIKNKIWKLKLEDESNEVIAELLNVPLKLVVESKEAEFSYMSWETPVLADGGGSKVVTLEDIISDLGYDSFTETSENDSVLDKFYLTLTDREREIWGLHASGKTQMQIGEVVGISQVHVSRTLNKVMKKAEGFGKQEGLR